MPQPHYRIIESDTVETIAGEEIDQQAEQLPAPTWFRQHGRTLPPESLAERYRSQRAEPARNEYEQRRAYVPPLQPARPLKTVRYLEELEQFYEDEVQPRAPKRAANDGEHRGSISRAYLIAGVAAMLAGGVLGFLVTNHGSIGSKVGGLFGANAAASPQPVAATAANQTVATKKLFATATLEVADVSGDLNSLIPLALHAEPGTQGDDLILKISGLPPSAYLTAGSKSKDNDWQLSPAEAQNAKLVVSQTDQPTFGMAVAAFEKKTGELAAPVKEVTVAINMPNIQVMPASAPPETVTFKTTAIKPTADGPSPVPEPKEVQVAIAAPPSEAEGLLAKGDILLKSGDMAMARQFYERAYAEGSTAAAIGAGKTYDPVVYADLKVQGLKPDPAKAMEWYDKAKAAGNTGAASAIDALKQAQP